MDDMDEFVQEFLVESYENLDELDRDLVALEQAPGSRELLSNIFRVIHTIKGTSGFLAFSKLEAVTHKGESLLARLRDGTQSMTAETADALLRMVDVVRVILGSIEVTGQEGEPEIEPVVAALAACITDGPAEAAGPAGATGAAEAAGAADMVLAPPAAVHVVPEPGEPGFDPEAAEPEFSAVERASTLPRPGQLEQLARTLPEPEPGEPTAARRSIAETSVRVDVDLLDTLMRIVGELVLTRNQLIRGVTDLGDQAVGRTAQRLNLLTSELQESVMKTRMQAIDQIFSKMPRVVRDLAAMFGKTMRVVIDGRETELDRSLLEAVKDPLTHLVRNAVDHGMEAPDVRVARGKPAEGLLTLRARHQAGNVLVEVSDDGGGIDPEVIGRIAVERKVITAGQLAQMEPREILRLVFRPGFSTAKEVTNVSGRGVGMDVVKTNIERIGGAVDVESTVGVGTTWRLTIPLTLAIIQALIVDCGPERYAIPQSSVRELVFVDGESGQAIEYISGAPVYRLRGKLLPLVRLDEALGFPPSIGNRAVYVAVVQADSRRFGLVVDRVLSTEEIVVKPLSRRFNEVAVYAGATILGDGKVSLILDVQGLARGSGLTEGVVEDAEVELAEAGAEREERAGRLLVVAVGDRRVAIPLQTVTRLESFAPDEVERIGSREVVQYRGSILPIMRLTSLLGASPDEHQVTLPVVVYTEGERSAGLAVDRILDIVSDDPDAARSELEEPGISGSTVVQQRVTELLNVRNAILAADPYFYSGEQDPAYSGEQDPALPWGGR